ncbi:MAG: SMC family ATPase, partial [Acidimicrobiales bacterium]
MRPLSLTVTGLRSHSGTTPVEFPDDWQLAAIIGPTGAGKSSLLEAIVYALFGCGTVPNASQPINLIADNTREMRVVLAFEVAGAKHELVRTYRRSGASPPPVLKSPGETISGVRPVDDAIMRLLRLSPDAFCQTALLPQGRFARLLEAGATEQKSTLDEFFRLGEVTEIAERLATASDQVSWARDRVSTVRGQLPANPDADLAVAQQALDSARSAASAAAELEVEVTRLLANAEAAGHRASEQEKAATTLDSAARSLDQVVADAGKLIALAADIGLQESIATTDLSSAHEAHEAARTRLDLLDARTVTAARTALGALNTRMVEAAQALADAVQLEGGALTTEEDYRAVEADLEQANDVYKRLDQIATVAEAAAEDADRRVRTGQALSEAAARTAQARTDAAGLVSQTATDLLAAKDAAEVAGAVLVEAEQLALAAHEQVAQADEYLASAGEATARALAEPEQLRTLANAYRDGQTAGNTAKEALAEATRAATQAREQSDAALALREAANTSYQHSEEALNLARRAEATSVCAAHVHAGDPCPVCGRELPNDFMPPEAPRELAHADEEMRAARKGLDAASEEASRALVRAETAEHNRVAAEETAAAATASLASSAAAYEAVGGDVALEQAETVAEAAAQESLRADKAAHSARQDAAAAEATLKSRGEALQPLHDASARAERARRAAVAALETTENPATEAAAAYTVFGGDSTLALAQTEDAAASGTATSARADAVKAKEVADLLNARREDLRVRAGNARTAASAARERATTTSAAARSAALDIPAPARASAGDDPSAILAAAEQWTTDREVQLRKAETAGAEAQTVIVQSEVALTTAQLRRAAEHNQPL